MCSPAGHRAQLETAPIDVRPATAADRPFVDQLAARFGATRAAWRGYDEVVEGTRRQLGTAFVAPLGQDGSALLIAVDRESEERLGFAYLVVQTDFFTGEAHGHLSEIAALPNRRGIGSVLMDAAEAWSRTRGFRYLSLNVNDANEEARRFYERRAYQPEYRHLVKLL